MAAPTGSNFGASHTHPTLTPFERLAILLKSPYLIATASFAFIRQVYLRRNISSSGLKVAGIIALGRSFPPNLTVRQLHSFIPTTGETIAAYCNRHKLNHSSVLLDVGSDLPPGRLHFLGSRPAFAPEDASKRVFLYIHGGGFVFPASRGHVVFATLAAQAADAELAMLEYTINLGTPYVAQVAQAAAAVQHLIDERGFKPEQIIIGGDSAGGRLALGLLSHLKVARPGVPLLPIGGTHAAKLKAVLLLSPGCSFDATTENSKPNEKYDVLSASSMEVFVRVFRAASRGVEASPLAEDADHWGTVAADKVLITAGRKEILYDAILKLAGLMQAKTDTGASVQLLVSPREIHAQSILETGVGILDGQGTSHVLSWLKDL